ncbi:hypothetical protein ACJIZ3_012237 [Penstemon smallii]|uniref:Uncharacterized protein n=1 Tax=Penstemon smallii TaxID=265156 RepID=A0ABD3ULT4_9LAMI
MGVNGYNAVTNTWKSAEWIAKSIRNKANRASDCDGRGYPINLGGSKSRATYSKEFKKKYERDPRLDEIFEVMNSRKLENGEREWGCGRSENAYNDYMERIASEVETDDGEDPRPPPKEVQMQVWTQVQGVSKKGTVYGLNSNRK